MLSTEGFFLILSGIPSSSTSLSAFCIDRDTLQDGAIVEIDRLRHWLDAFDIFDVGGIWLSNKAPSVVAIQIPLSRQKHAENMLGRHKGLTNSVRVKMNGTISTLRTSLDVLAVRVDTGKSLSDLDTDFMLFKVPPRHSRPNASATRWDRDYPSYPKPSPNTSIPAGVLGLLPEAIWSGLTVQLANPSDRKLKRQASLSSEDDSPQFKRKRTTTACAVSNDAHMVESMNVDTGCAGLSGDESNIWGDLLDECSVFWFS